jgi:hypothetical protein
MKCREYDLDTIMKNSVATDAEFSFVFSRNRLSS